MGGGKIKIKRLEKYLSRGNGIMKKAKEISVLCGAKVSLVIFASSGNMLEYCSPSTSLIDILDIYQKLSGKRLWDPKHENLSNEIDRIKKENDNMQIELRHLNGEDITSLNHRELMVLEDALENGLSSIRETLMDYWRMTKKNVKILEEENEALNFVLQQQEMAMEAASREMDDDYEQRVRDYDSQMPLAFRVQPVQPNLQRQINEQDWSNEGFSPSTASGSVPFQCFHLSPTKRRIPPADESSVMHAMLHDIFDMQHVRADEGGSEVGVQAETVQEDPDDFDEGARKFFDLLKGKTASANENTEELMSQDPPTSRLCTYNGTIPWSSNDVDGQVMGPEYLGCVHGLGLGPRPGRSSYSSSRASTSASQDPELASHINELKAQMTQMQILHEGEMAQMRKLFAMLIEGSAHRSNAPNNISDIISPHVIPKSSMGRGAGEHSNVGANDNQAEMTAKDRQEEMGRGKIEIKRIENSTNRQVTYTKRRNGIIKKATEISVLCDAKVSLVIFSSSGKMHDYCSPSTSLTNILDKYHKCSGKRLWDPKHENLRNEIDRIKKENDNMQIELRHLKGEDITSLNPRELMLHEEALENGLSSIRERQMDYWRMAKKNDKIMEEENKDLRFTLHQQEMAMEAANREIDDYYERTGRDYNSQMPLAFRVQPIQPNLQKRM
ncbi:uncharacterized protein LOC133867485 isoform X2 [Alnus glutinosa]|uniref:uncharacterized protein LOC133867485 isoform X2 n=1 Tax=Alnus glutinosa TaxID=3517 RepID=UPI002D776556|nr:uncharacterized protein LOC133867485 isoform X2 [Alnus glutinosa]